MPRGMFGGNSTLHPNEMRPVRDKLWYLRQINVFAELDDAELHRLAERTTMREVRRGQVICHPSEQPQQLYLIKEGRVKLSRYSPQGREQILGLLEPGNLFGELLLVGEYEPVHVEAFEDGLICTLSREDFFDLIRRHPELLIRVIRALADRLRAVEEEIVDLAFLNVPGRLAAVILRLAETQNRHDGNEARLPLRITHHEIASMIGATRETVTNTLSRFRDERLITIDQGHIIIRDFEGLRRLSPKD